VRPLWIELEGVRSFVTARRIDFAGLNLFAIVGDTGAGKSSILEAMIYALFNGTTWSGRDVKELMSTGAARMRVRFAFAIGNRTYAVSRITPRIGVPQHLLECEGHSEERCDNEGPVSRRVEELLGVNRETFIKTVVLPQGEFAELLKLTPARRTKMLTDVLGLSVLDDMVRSLAAPRIRAATLLAGMKGKRSSLPTDPAEAVAAAQEASAGARARANDLDNALQTARTHTADINTLNNAIQARANDRTDLVAAGPAVKQLESLFAADAFLQRAIADTEEKLTTANALHAAATADIEKRAREGCDVAGLAAAMQIAAQLVANLNTRQSLDDELAERRKALVSAEIAVEERAQHEREALRTVDEGARVQKEADANAAAALGALGTAERAILALIEARAALTKSVDRASKAEESLARTSRGIKGAQETRRVADAWVGSAEAALQEAQRINAAAHASLGLGPGDPCPVCERELPVGFHPSAAADLHDRENAAQRARDDARDAHARVARAEAEGKAAQELLVQAREECLRRRDDTDRAARDVCVAGIDSDVGDVQAALEMLRERAQCLDQEAHATRSALLRARSILTTAAAKHAAETAHRDHEQTELERCGNRATELARASMLLRNQLPPVFRPAEDADAPALEAVRSRISGSLLAAREAERLRDDARRDVNNSTSERLVIERQRDREITIPQRLVSSQLAKVGTLVCRLLPADGNATERVPEQLTDLVTWACTLQRSAAIASEQLVADDARDLERRFNLNAALHEVVSRCAASSIDTLQEIRDDALGTSAVAYDTLLTAQQGALSAAGLDRDISSLEPLSRALDALHAALSDAQFKDFVAERKQERLLAVATTTLRRMTADRYGFGKQFTIIDRTARQERSSQTLSGGEKFLASLALSLALVEIAERSGIRFGAFFLDEGFGTLDQNALDQALSELERQAGNGRMIGVITHIRAVTEYIDDALRVTKTPAGSDVQRLEQEAFDAIGLPELAPSITN
jgi:exonuclease SbcC